MSGRASIQLTTARWRAPSIITSARNLSTSPWSFQGTADTRSSQDVDIIRRLRKHERSTAAALNADLDDFLDRFDRFYKPKSTVDEGVQTALRQNKYISTERLRHDETVATIGKDVVEQYGEFRKHLKDYEEEPYPEWQPGDSDVVTRQLSQSSRKLQDYEDEKKSLPRTQTVVSTRTRNTTRLCSGPEMLYVKRVSGLLRGSPTISSTPIGRFTLM